MSRSRIYTMILLDDLEGAELGTGDVLTFAPAAPVPLTAGYRIVDTVDYLEVMAALHGDRIVATPSSRGALVALKNAWLRAHGVHSRRPLAGSAAAVRTALKVLADPAAVLPTEPAGHRLPRA